MINKAAAKRLILAVWGGILRGEMYEREVCEGGNHNSAHRMNALLRAIIIFCGVFSAIDHAFAQFSFASLSSTNVGDVFDIKISGNYAYLAATQNGLTIVDVSNPMNPVRAGQIFNGGNAIGVAVSGHYAYLANFNDGLRIYDVSDPRHPTNVARGSDGGFAEQVRVAGNYAYVTGGHIGLRIYDVSNPASPIMVGQTNNGGLSFNVIVSGNYACVTYPNSSNTLCVYDVSNPANPASVYLSGSGYDFGEALSSNRLYVAQQGDKYARGCQRLGPGDSFSLQYRQLFSFGGSLRRVNGRNYRRRRGRW